MMESITTDSIRTSILSEEASLAWEYFKQEGYPNSTHENWRFSNPEPFLLKNAPVISEKLDFSRDEFDFLMHTDATNVFIVNGKVLVPETLPEGMKLIHYHSDIQEIHTNEKVGGVADIHASPFIAENTALFQSCTVINVTEGRKIEQPLHLIQINLGTGENRIFPRLLLNLKPGSQLHIRETEYSGDSHSWYVNGVTECIIHENAHLTWNTLQKRNEKSGQFSSFNAALEKDAALSYSSIELGCSFLRRDANIHLHSPGSDCSFNSLFLPSGKQHIDISTVMHHESPHCSSRQLVKGILADKSTGVFRGLANVYKEAEKTNAHQTNQNLLISPDARMNSIPQLEIYEDDVKCSHGSTTGQIDEDSLFYLQSRGISRKDGIQLMVKGFANEVVEKCNDETFSKIVSQAIESKLGGLL
ncbi:MAG: Fe-S cluster assembly protein SufD [Candidatus Marinimicrobia bacterium]|jgi:Fe-S cluster assembly protein SufD|nr:Fe-S cluster assembly protein SufD [Candidatus Neomarinimicrobiota bacterium]